MARTQSESEILLNLGHNLRKVRLDRNFTQVQLATASGIQKANLSRLESGRINTTAASLNRIATALKVNVREFFDYKKPFM